MNNGLSAVCGVAVALLGGVLMGGEERVRQHVELVASTIGFKGKLPPKLVTDESLKEMKEAVSIGGIVYDVAGSKELYGEAGWYNYFVGRDATVVFGTGKRVGYSLETGLKDGRDASDCSDATPAELSKICHYIDVFSKKYRKIGVLANGLYYTSSGDATPLRTDVEARCLTVKQTSHTDGGDAAEEDVFLSHDPKRGSKCPVMKATKAVKKMAADAQQYLQRLLA